MTIQSIVFQRKRAGEWEEGILINEGTGPVLDFNGHEVKEVWDYRRTPRLLIELVPMVEGEEKCVSPKMVLRASGR